MQENSFQSLESRTAGNSKPISTQSWKKGSALYRSTPTEKNFENVLNEISQQPNPDVTYSYQQQDVSAPKTRNYEFKDVIDVINPLHHLPLVGTLYRSLTGDELHPASRFIGGSIYGGPIGAISAVANNISEMQTGRDLGDHILGMARGDLPTRENSYSLASYAYQEVADIRTAGWSASNRDYDAYDTADSFLYEPVTELSLSAMPPKRIYEDV